MHLRSGILDDASNRHHALGLDDKILNANYSTLAFGVILGWLAGYRFGKRMDLFRLLL